MEKSNNLHRSLSIIFGIVIICLVLLVTMLFSNQSPVSNSTNTSAPISTPTQTPIVTQTLPADTTKKTSSIYKDGTYSVTGSYMTHAGQENIGVMITLKDDIITDVTVTPEPEDNISAHYQSLFISGYKSLVVGKNIADVNLGKVSGSSLTPKGFNDALTQIKAQAKA